jgi:hypothetical protein
MIEAMLTASGHPEAAEFIDQPHIRNELRDIADRGTTAGRSGAIDPRRLGVRAFSRDAALNGKAPDAL